MSNLSYHVLDNSLVVSFNGKHFNISKGDARFAPVLKAIKENKLDDIPSLVDVRKAYAAMGFVLKDGQLQVDGETVAGAIADRIIKFQSEGIPFDSLIKFIRKLRKNPSFNSREQLYKFLEHNGHPITSEGNFIAYRGVTEDFKDLHTRKFDNKPGSICEMPRDQVDDNPNNTCSRGLHVACYDYAKSFGPRLVEVEVDPADVVAVPTDYNGTKMRTCRFKVVQVCEKLNEATMVDSSYEATPSPEMPEVETDWDEVADVIGERCEHGTNDPCGECGDDLQDDEEWTELLQLKPSEVVELATYNRDNGELTVKLHDGSEYVYENVALNVTFEWEDSPSTGRYYVNHIAHNYKYRQA